MYIKAKCLVKKILKYKTVLKHKINEVMITFNFYKPASLIGTAQIVHKTVGTVKKGCRVPRTQGLVLTDARRAGMENVVIPVYYFYFCYI